MSEPLGITLMDQDEIAQMIRSKAWWVCIFGLGHLDYIDKLDTELAIYPTCPTLMGPGFPITFIPKQKVSRKRMEKVLIAIGDESKPPNVRIAKGQDVLIITDDMNEAAQMGVYAKHLMESGDKQHGQPQG